MIRTAILGLLLLTSVALSQVTTTQDSSGRISVTTRPSGADVYVDSLFVGKSPLREVTVTPGRHALKAFYPSVFAWDPLVVADSIDVSPGTNPEKQIVLGTILRVQTIPYGGSVFLERTIVGTTPLTLRSPDVVSDRLLITRKGYDSLRVSIDGHPGDFLRARLVASSVVPADWESAGNGRRLFTADHWLSYASGGTMIASGVLSAYLKDRANREFDRYLQSKDPGSLSTTRRLDRGATVALVVSQISFVVLAAILLSE